MSQRPAGQSGGDALCYGPFAATRAGERRESARRSHPKASTKNYLSTAPPPFNVNSQPHEDVFFTAAHLRRPHLQKSAHTLSPPYHVRDLRENDLRNYPLYLCLLHCKRTLSFKVVWLYAKANKNISDFEKFSEKFFGEGAGEWRERISKAQES